MKKTNAVTKNSELTSVLNSHFQKKINLARVKLISHFVSCPEIGLHQNLKKWTKKVNQQHQQQANNSANNKPTTSQQQHQQQANNSTNNKPTTGRKSNCKLITGLIIKTVNFF